MSAKRMVVKHLSDGNVLRDISFELVQGERVALMGSNGAGKSTLARILAGLMQASTGEVQLWQDEERLGWEQLERWRMIALVGQHPRRQTIGATVSEELGFGMLNLGLQESEIRTKVREMMMILGLEDQADQSLVTLSGGERQRLVIAAFLLIQPSFMIFDEAFSMLDRHSEERILNLLGEPYCQAGQIWITHDRKLAAKADRVLLLQDGMLKEIEGLYKFVNTPTRLRALTRGKPPVLKSANSQARVQREVNIKVTNDVNKELNKEVNGTLEPLLEWVKAVYFDRVQITQKVFAGDFIGILGPSGAGKSTILESVTGMVQPEKGELLLAGYRTGKKNAWGIHNREDPKLSLDWGYLLQEAGEYMLGSTVFQELIYGVSRRKQKELRKKYPEIFAAYDLPLSWADLPPERLSGGERQKVAVVAAICNHPSLLLLDEPMLGLDKQNRAGIMELIGCLKNKTVLYATHDLQEVLPWANRLWLVEKGKIHVQCDAADWHRHHDEFIKAGVRC